MNAAAGSIIILAAIAGFIYYYRSSWLLNPAALFTLSWIGGMGVSHMKLSFLQGKWELMTWYCVLGAWVCFLLSYLLLRRKLSKKPEKSEAGMEEARTGNVMNSPEKNESGAALFVFILTGVSWGAFFVEAILLGYIPLFTVETPHAYSYFHISGLHYFTVSCVLVPAAAVIYYSQLQTPAGKTGPVAVCTALSVLLPILMVSRFQLIFAAAIAMFTWAALNRQNLSRYLRPRLAAYFGIGIALLICLYVFLTFERAHSISYLNGIFEMRDPNTPIWITQPYMYIANNYDNLNCLIRDLPEHTHGLRMLFPLFALTGLKFLHPEWTSFPIYVTKEELTTVTLIYDAYYDFGLAGVLVFSLVLGAAAALLEQLVFRYGRNCPFLCLAYGQFAFYLLFSFFTTWYSNPATWFYYGITLLAGIAVMLGSWRKKQSSHRY